MIVDPALSRGRYDRDLRPVFDSHGSYQQVGVELLVANFPHTWFRLAGPLGHDLVLYVEATDYSYRPVTGWWVIEAGSTDALLEHFPSGAGFAGPHAPDGSLRTWFCFPGWRDYHDHTSHVDPPWSAFRPSQSYRLPAIVLQLRTDLNKPGVQFT